MIHVCCAQKELSSFIPIVGEEGENLRTLLNIQEYEAYQFYILNCISESFSQCRKIMISSPNYFILN